MDERQFPTSINLFTAISQCSSMFKLSLYIPRHSERMTHKILAECRECTRRESSYCTIEMRNDHRAIFTDHREVMWDRLIYRNSLIQLTSTSLTPIYTRNSSGTNRKTRESTQENAGRLRFCSTRNAWQFQSGSSNFIRRVTSAKILTLSIDTFIQE